MGKLSNYTKNYYNRNIPETWFWRNGLLRPDQLAAVCYIKNLPFFGNERYPKEPYNPHVIYSIGAGRGELEKTLEKLGFTVYGIDPSEGSKKMYEGKNHLDTYPGGGDVVLFCESVEHISERDFGDIWAKIPIHARVVIVNWPSIYPIKKDKTGWDHIRQIDDIFFDKLSEENRVIIRHGSHLVLEKLEPLEEKQKKEWARPPLDGIGYISSKHLLSVSDDELKSLVQKFRDTRYTGWRNYEGKWRKYMGIDDTTGKTILDFGCGVGIESLEFAQKGNNVIAADLVRDNVELAKRIASLYGQTIQTIETSWKPPYINLPKNSIDILYMDGVLHHIPYAHDLLRESLNWLRPHGEIRAMLYSDRGWAKYVKAEVPPFDSDVTQNPNFNKFLRVFDRVGYYTDWYSRKRLEWRFGDLVDITMYEYVTDDCRYCVARMAPK